MTKVMSNFIAKECKVLKELRKNEANNAITNYTILRGDHSKGLNFYDSDGFDHNNENLLRENVFFNPSLKYLSAVSVKNISDLTLLTICRANIKQINECYFKDMTNLKQIDFSFNKIEHIEENTFRNLNKLEKIILSQNKLRTIRARTFVDLPQLTLIDLHNNEINRIERNSFIKLPLLKKLLLSFNQLTEMNGPVIFENLSKLEEIDFHYNKIDSVEFRLMFNLEKLDLSKNRIKAINKNSFQDLPKLKELNLTSNEIEMIELGSFCHNMLHLESCDLRSNGRLEKVDFLVLSMAEKKINFDPNVKLVEYSRLSIETLLDVFSFYNSIECYDSKTKEIFFKLNPTLFISIDLDDFKYQNDHILSNFFRKRRGRMIVASSFWVHVYDMNRRIKYSRDHKKIESDLEMKELNFRFEIRLTNRDQLKKVLRDLLNQMEVDFRRSNSNETTSVETYRTFFKSLNELKWMH